MAVAGAMVSTFTVQWRPGFGLVGWKLAIASNIR